MSHLSFHMLIGYVNFGCMTLWLHQPLCLNSVWHAETPQVFSSPCCAIRAALQSSQRVHPCHISTPDQSAGHKVTYLKWMLKFFDSLCVSSLQCSCLTVCICACDCGGLIVDCCLTDFPYLQGDPKKQDNVIFMMQIKRKSLCPIWQLERRLNATRQCWTTFSNTDVNTHWHLCWG